MVGRLMDPRFRGDDEEESGRDDGAWDAGARSKHEAARHEEPQLSANP